MRFLCLHGAGSRTEILETQVSKVQESLGPRYEFIFLQGTVMSEAGPGVAGIHPGPYHSFFELPTSSGLRDIFHMIEDAWELDGPFDGLLGFSQGGSVAASYLLQDHTARKPFKCAVFFCSSMPFDPDSSPWKYTKDGSFMDCHTGRQIATDEMAQSIPEAMTFDWSKYPRLGDQALLRRYSVGSPDDSPRIYLPTVHVLASNDGYYEQSKNNVQLCRPYDREVVVHEGGHAIPWDEETTQKIVECIHNMTLAADLA